MAEKEFSFEKKDFEIEATRENDKYRTRRFRELLAVFKPSLSISFENTTGYVNVAGVQGTSNPKVYRAHTWLGIYFGGGRDTPQFQVNLTRDGVGAFINIDATSDEGRKNVLAVLEKDKDKCFDILKKLDDDWYVHVKNRNTTKKFKATGLSYRTEWKISELELKDIDQIIKYLGFRGADLEVGRGISREKTLEMKTGIVSELKGTFENLLPLHKFLTANNSGGKGGDSIDEKFEAWLERNARKAGMKVEDYAKSNGLMGEAVDRHIRFKKLREVLDEEPIDQTKIFPALKKAIQENWTQELLKVYLKDDRMLDAINALKEYKDETDIETFFNIMQQILPPGREDAKKTKRLIGLEDAGQLATASVFLTSLHPDKFVDYRKGRWERLAKQIGIEEEFATVKDAVQKEKELEEVGKFAKMITETPTFKTYFGGSRVGLHNEPLWTLAGICWAVKGDKDEEGDKTNMDELVEEILQMKEYKLAIDKNVVKRIIRHLRGGKNVVLVGAPGVGKTELAKKILEIVGKEDNETEKFVERVAHAEWTKRDVVGGLNLKDKFVPGCVTIAAQEKKWLLIDEFNRADINKAFGEMFLGIESNTIQLTPEEAEGRSDVEGDKKIINIPEKFRMVCTMNDYDKNLLLTELSFGLITRFAFVDIKPNEEEELDSIKAQLYKDVKINSNDYEKCKGVVEKFYDFIKALRAAKHDRMIGVRTCVDVFRYTVSASKEEGKINPEDFLDEALCDYVLPQFDRLDKHVIESAIAAAKANLPSVEKSEFFKSLNTTLIGLKKLTSWFGDKSDDDYDDELDVGETSKSNVDAKKKNYSPRAYKAHDTMRGKVKANDIEWARKHPKNYYAKQIFKNNSKKSKKK